MPLLLGIDIGTSSAKAVLFDTDTAQALAVAGHEYPIDKPAPDRAEQDPEDWWQATVDVVRRVVVQSGRTDIAAIGLSGQMHGAVLVDQTGAPVCPAIIWADQRTADMSRSLTEAIGADRYTAIAGTLPAAGFMGPTLVWLAQHEPALLVRTHQVILPKDYVRWHLTGETATDVSDAASTALFNVTKQTWSAELLRHAGLPDAIFPRVLASSDIAGRLTAQAAEMLGLTEGIPVAVGCADQPAQAIANGLIAPGTASVTTGSGGQVFIPLRREADKPILTDYRVHIFNHAIPQMWYILGAILSAGLALRWLRKITGLDGKPDAYAILSAEAASIAPGADGLIFLPYLSGERTPLLDPLARGSFIGLSYHHERAHLARAVMEGVAFALRQALEISLSLGAQVETIIAAGGGAESDTWRQIQADVFGLPLRKTLLTEQASVGAALLSGVGTGMYASFYEACRQVVRYGAVTEPDMNLHRQYNRLYEQFVGLYPQLRANFHWLARFPDNIA